MLALSFQQHRCASIANVCCVNGFRFDSHLGTFHFGSSPMVALVKRPPFYFLQIKKLSSPFYFYFLHLFTFTFFTFLLSSKFQTFVFRFIVCLVLGFSALIPNLVHSITHSSCVTVTLQVTDEFQIRRSTDEPITTTGLLETKVIIIAHWLVKYVSILRTGIWYICTSISA